MTSPPPLRPGDVVEVAEPDYEYGLSPLILRVLEVGARERRPDGIWLNLRGVQLRPADGRPLRQRRALVRLAATHLRHRPPRPTRELP